MQCDFVLGERVVCVDAGLGGQHLQWHGDPPVEGKVYTIRGMVPGRTLDGRPMVLLYFREIRRSLFGKELGYFCIRFRKLHGDSQEVSGKEWLERLLRTPLNAGQ